LNPNLRRAMLLATYWCW